MGNYIDPRTPTNLQVSIQDRGLDGWMHRGYKRRERGGGRGGEQDADQWGRKIELLEATVIHYQ